MSIDPDNPPTKEPDKITAGANAKWIKSLPNNKPEDGWALTYYLHKAGNKITIPSTDNLDSRFLINELAATTAPYTAGEYEMKGFAAKGADVFECFIGSVEILADPIAGAATDLRSFAKKTLDAIEANISGRASRSDQEYSIEGRSLKRMTMEELQTAYVFWRTEVAKEVLSEKVKNGCGNPRKIKVQFIR